MISHELLGQVDLALAAYRGKGREEVLFDSRDPGNYGAYDWEDAFAMLLRIDPTGLAAAMMLNEMIEATINGSQVKLSRVLREDGFIDKLGVVLAIKYSLATALEYPMLSLMAQVDHALDLTSAELGKATSREVAICLRDAIYCLDKGLPMRWLTCDHVQTSARIPLCLEIPHFPTIAAFVHSLRTTMPLGAHLARIGRNYTAIGLKQPGRVAYLSSLSLSAQDGSVIEDRVRGSNLAERLDLDTPVERYPEWVTSKFRDNTAGNCVISGVDTHLVNHIAKLPRDRLIWLAMVVEIAGQRMAAADPSTVELSESLALALPMDHEAPVSLLPAIITPNWVAAPMTLAAGFAALKFSDWETRFLAPALEGMKDELFLPVGDRTMALKLGATVLVPWNNDDRGYFDKFKEEHIKIDSLSPGWVGTRAETESVRKKLYLHNLARYLLTWGNTEFKRQWETTLLWMKERIEHRLPGSLDADFVTLKPANFYDEGKLRIYRQSPKHKGYRPHCFFNGKKAVTHVALFRPRNSEDIVVMLGLSGESELPSYLRGWKLGASWAMTDDRGIEASSPVQTYGRWSFARSSSEGDCLTRVSATVCFNEESVPASVIAAHQARQEGKKATGGTRWPF